MTDQPSTFDLPAMVATTSTSNTTDPTALDIVMVVATATAIHPPGTPLDENGDPVAPAPEPSSPDAHPED